MPKTTGAFMEKIFRSWSFHLSLKYKLTVIVQAHYLFHMVKINLLWYVYNYSTGTINIYIIINKIYIFIIFWVLKDFFSTVYKVSFNMFVRFHIKDLKFISKNYKNYQNNSPLLKPNCKYICLNIIVPSLVIIILILTFKIILIP